MIAQEAAVAIMEWLHRAEEDLVGSTIATFNGEAGTVHALKLDEHHGLCFTIDETPGLPKLRRFYPVSTIRMRS